jgi:hypothetical protein
VYDDKGACPTATTEPGTRNAPAPAASWGRCASTRPVRALADRSRQAPTVNLPSRVTRRGTGMAKRRRPQPRDNRGRFVSSKTLAWAFAIVAAVLGYQVLRQQQYEASSVGSFWCLVSSSDGPSSCPAPDSPDHPPPPTTPDAPPTTRSTTRKRHRHNAQPSLILRGYPRLQPGRETHPRHRRCAAPELFASPS